MKSAEFAKASRAVIEFKVREMSSRYDYTPGQARLVGLQASEFISPPFAELDGTRDSAVSPLWTRRGQSGRPTTQWQNKPHLSHRIEREAGSMPETLQTSITVMVTDSTRKFTPVPCSKSDEYLKGYNDRMKYAVQVVSMKVTPLFTVGPRRLGRIRHVVGTISGVKSPRLYTVSSTQRQAFEQTREIEDTPQPDEKTGKSTKNERSLRGYLKTKSLEVTEANARKYKLAWYAFGCPSQLTEPSAPDTPMVQYEVTSTVYIRNFYRAEAKFGRNVAPSIFDCFWHIHPEPSSVRTGLYIKVFRERSRNITMHAGTDMFGMQPIGKFWTGKKGPTRAPFVVDFMSVDITPMNKRERVWWAGEVFRFNIKKDGMRLVMGRMNEQIAAYFGVNEKTVRRSAADSKPLNKARGPVSEYIEPKEQPSEEGAGFKGISGEWRIVMITTPPMPWETLLVSGFRHAWRMCAREQVKDVES